MIHLLNSSTTPQQLSEMLEELEDYVKLAVDIEQGVAAGGGALHADCESLLLANGSRQESIWGADWIPQIREVRYESFINIRPRQNNPAMMILDPAIRIRVEEIARRLFEGVMNDAESKQSDRRERYLRDPLPTRLGNLASNLLRIKSLSNHLTMGEAAARVVDESIFFIQWTEPDASLPQQSELAELKGLLTRWRLEWAEIWNDLEKRNSIAEQAGAWSEKILDRSGLLNS